uniref:Uncharacterized protein n=1 Tax=Phalansterium sp. PJK-2012 TaxID=1267188 RepID=T1QE27_9EUKA|nr:hypothetical protein [Phalansterium sp. PJK-2012]
MTIDIINFFISTVGTVIPIVCAVLLCTYDIREGMEKSYFRNAIRQSLSSSSIFVLDETKINETMLIKRTDVNIENFYVLSPTEAIKLDVYRPLNDSEIEKLKFYQNYPMKIDNIKLWNINEKKFDVFNFYLLFQRGDENSLLRKGVHFIIEHENGRRYLIPSTLLVDSSIDISTNSNVYGFNTFFNITKASALIRKHMGEEEPKTLEDVIKSNRLKLGSIIILEKLLIMWIKIMTIFISIILIKEL